jgi:hypothetical protein
MTGSYSAPESVVCAGNLSQRSAGEFRPPLQDRNICIVNDLTRLVVHHSWPHAHMSRSPVWRVV